MLATIVEITCAGWHRTIREPSSDAAKARVERVVERYGPGGSIARDGDTVTITYDDGDVITLLVCPEAAGAKVTESLDERLAEIDRIARHGLITREEYIMRVADAYSDAMLQGDEVPTEIQTMVDGLLKELSPR